MAASAATVTAPASAASKSPDWVTLLAGDAHHAVWELSHTSGTGSARSVGDPYKLVARASDGTVKTFALTAGDQYLEHLRYSLAKTTLTTIDQADRSTVHWWNIGSGDSGALTIPLRSYVAAYPSGVLFMTKRGVLSAKSTAGVITTLSRPWTNRPNHLSGRVGARGVVISDYPGQARYVPFASPTKVQKLRTGVTRGIVVCGALSATYAACTTFGALEGRPIKPALIPVDGAKPIVANDGWQNFGQVALIGTKTLVWTRFAERGSSDSVAAAMTAGSIKHTVGTHRVAFGADISAYGKVLLLSKDHCQVFQARSPTHLSVVYTAPWS
jgi:hypothetical protein